ncbi:MAG: flagellar biosynthetic protein FlhB [Cellvibrionaceae bacterium]|jgi:flagellar biosynthetic protein FlhB
MSDNDQAQEKTEDPTSKKLEKAKEDGQAPRSKELTTTAVLLGASFAFLWFGEFLSNKITSIFVYSFSVSREEVFDTAAMTRHLAHSFGDALIGLFPFFAILLLAAILGPLALGGWIFSTKSLMPKLSRMDPLEGTKRMFSAKSLVELAKAIAKVSLMLVLTVLLLKVFQGDLASLSSKDVNAAMIHSIMIAIWVTMALSAATILISLIDVPFQIWDHTKKLRMSLQDIKDEMKDTDGKPEVKSKIRQLQQEMANRRMMGEVPDADVVITNPTHFAVAIKYQPDDMKTPIVVAKGVEQVALKIREIAGAHQVEIVAAPRLARAIFYTTKLDEEIPSGLYIAVAKVLAYVFQLQNFRKGQGPQPTYPRVVSVPDDMIYGE